MQIIVTIDLPAASMRPTDDWLAFCLRGIAERVTDGFAAGSVRDAGGERVGQFGIEERPRAQNREGAT
jgi:hypothetical protein